MKHAANLIRLSADWPAVEILYIDAHLLALNKPAGLLVSPDRWGKERANLMGLLNAGIAAGKPWARDLRLDYLANAHRLDFNTSGVLLLARARPALASLAGLFHRRAVRKTYVALAHGRPAEDRIAIDWPIAPHPQRPGLAVIDQRSGKPAQTIIELLEAFNGYALLTAQPLTGRLHQIRVHLQAAGCPLVGDQAYGGKALLLSRLKPNYKLKAEGEKPLISRPALHALDLQFPHPISGAALTITAPWPKDLTIAVKYLRKFAA
jgi:RluA family pseudouridine synthase